MESNTSWLEYLRLSTPPTMFLSVFIPLGIFGITIPSSSSMCCTPYTLFSSITLFFPHGDDTPHSCTTTFSVSCSYSGSRTCCMELVASSSCCDPFPLDVSDSVCSTSSFGFLSPCVGFFSSSTCNVVYSYFGVWISSTSTTVGISTFLVCGT
jgi:hypothetical protein